MKIKETNPTDCFGGMGRDGWLDDPNRFYCPVCEYGIYFNKASLEKGSINQQSEPLKLKPEDGLLFMRPIQRFISNHSDRFILDFYCPGCKSPYVIGFEVSEELHMGHYLYRPVKIFNASNQSDT
jgi:hypothetical protein